MPMLFVNKAVALGLDRSLANVGFYWPPGCCVSRQFNPFRPGTWLPRYLSC